MMIIKKMRTISITMLIGSSVFWGSVSGAQAPAVAGDQPAAQAKADGWKPQQLPSGAKEGNWTMVKVGSGNENLKLQRISVGDVDNVWGIGELEAGKDNANIYRLGREHENEDEKWVLKESGIDVSVGSDGTVVIIKKVDGKNRLLKRKVEGDKETWEPIFPDKELTRVSVANGKTMWGVCEVKKDEYKAYRLKDGALEPLKSMKGDDALGFKLFALAEDKDGEDVVFAIDTKGSMYRLDVELVRAINKTEKLRKSSEVQEQTKKGKMKKGKQKKKAKAGRVIQRQLSGTKAPKKKAAGKQKKKAKAAKKAKKAGKVAQVGKVVKETKEAAQEAGKEVKETKEVAKEVQETKAN